MASDDDTKPNLRPTKHVAAGGKTLYLHHNPKHPSNKSYIHATWNTDKEKTNASLTENPFGIEQPHIEYSLNKHQRWAILDNFRQQTIGYESSTTENDDNEIQSDSEQQYRRGQQQQQKMKKKTNNERRRIKYRLYEFHNTERQANCVSITSNTGLPRVQTPQKTYMQGPPRVNAAVTRTNQLEGNEADLEEDDVTYYAVVPPPRDKEQNKIRKQTANRGKKATSSVQRAHFTQVKERMDGAEQLEADEEADDDEPITPETQKDESRKPGTLRLDDFIPTAPIDEGISTSGNASVISKFDPKSSRIYVPEERAQHDAHRAELKRLAAMEKSQENKPKHAKKFGRQISKEEKLYNRDMAAYKKLKESEKPVLVEVKSHHHLMALSFRSVSLQRTDLTVKHLASTYGKNFIHAESYPTKYLIRLTDRLKRAQWQHHRASAAAIHFDLFPIYCTLDSYLIIVLDENDENKNVCRGSIALNMDLYVDTIEIDTLDQSIYTIDQLIEKTIDFIIQLPFDSFKPIDNEIHRRTHFKADADADLSESEFINKQIREIQLLDKKPTSTTEEESIIDASLENYTLIKPQICTNCYRDMDESIPMTAMKTCAHWLCNDCWRQYLENTIKRVTVVLCPEWNCCSVVDVGTILSLVNVRCMNIYERNIEKCLVNLSRSYVKCPATSCSNIVQVIGNGIDNVRCRCGHTFCINCKQEAHFPAQCNVYRAYMDEVYRNGDHISDYHAIIRVSGRNCVSCNHFIEKNGGCNHMTCPCGAEFCWSCAAYWKDHYTVDGSFTCPKPHIPLREENLTKQRHRSRRFYYNAISHRRERFFEIQTKRKENAKRLIGTIPMEKLAVFDTVIIQSQLDKREAMLQHAYEMANYVDYLHRICEFVAVAADGYANSPPEFRNNLAPLETVVFNMSQLLEGGRGYKAIEHLKVLHGNSEKELERLRRMVAMRELRRRQNPTGYGTS